MIARDIPRSRGEPLGGLACFDEPESASDLAVGDPAETPGEVLPGFAAFADRIGDAFAFELVFYLREGGHDREQHQPHGGCGVHVTAAEVQYARRPAPRARSSSAKRN
ncbi:hypothetical protein GCM10027405_29500 [Arthrobacter alkaliphilus]